MARGHHHSSEPRGPRAEVAVRGHEALRYRPGAAQHLPRTGGVDQRVSSTHTSAAPKPIWPKESAVPKFAAPRAAAIAAQVANAPSRTTRSRAVLRTVGRLVGTAADPP